MKVSELLKQDKVTLSFEVFPPKTSSSYESVARATQEIAALRSGFHERNLRRRRRHERAHGQYRGMTSGRSMTLPC